VTGVQTCALPIFLNNILEAREISWTASKKHDAFRKRV